MRRIGLTQAERWTGDPQTEPDWDLEGQVEIMGDDEADAWREEHTPDCVSFFKSGRMEE